jgi:methionyl-tRNA synthetase
MVGRYRERAVPAWSDAAATDFARLAGNVVDEYCSHMDALEFDEALNAFWKTVQAANRYVEQQKPWELAKADDTQTLDTTLRVLLEVLRLSSVLCIPFMPSKAADMRGQLGLDADITRLSIDEAKQPGAAEWKTVEKPSPLFPKIDPPAEAD